MALLKSAWGIFAALVTATFVALVAAPAYALTVLILRGTGITGAEWRRTHSRFMFKWAKPTFGLFCFLMRIVQVHLQRRHHQAFPPAIVVSNHQSLTDIFVLMTLLPEMGCEDARWVMKEELARIPLISHVCRGNASAFINRRDPEGSEREIRRTARLATEDNGSVIIFPEGTRFVPKEDGYPDPAGGRNYMHVRAPKPRGFTAIKDEMPTQDILLVTIDWGEPVRAKSFFQLGALFGRTAVVRTERHYAPVADAAWLNARWREIENRLERTRRK